MSDDDKTIIAGTGGRIAPGVRLNGIYQIDQLVGAGGMSEIYRGHNVQTFEKVAIKVVLPHFARDEQIVSLFRREALILNRLNHEGIIRYHVFSHDPVADLLYLAMEFVEGPTLRERMKNRPLSQLEACQLVAKVAAGLRAAHGEGVVHRDLSADNIILTNGDVSKPKVIDFGIARAGDANDSTLIEAGFAGKYNYVSPEQLGLFGGQVGPAADVYSLGLVFAGALRGKPLDMSGSHADVVMKRQSVPDLSQLNPSVKPLIERMLQPKPVQRIKSMTEVMAGIEEIVGPKARGDRLDRPVALAGSRPVTAAQPKPGSRWPLVVLLALACVCAGWALDRFGIVDASGLIASVSQSAARMVGRSAGEPEDETGKSQARAPLATAPSTEAPAAITSPSSVVENGADAGATASATSEDGAGRIPSPPSSPPQQAAKAEQPPAGGAAPPSGPRISLDDDSAPLPVAGAAPPVGETPIAEWLRSFDGGDCFYVRSLGVGANSASIEGFARSVAPLENLDKDFRSAFGFEPTIRMRPIEPAQCAALDLAEAARGAMRIELDNDLVGSGQSLTARVADIASRRLSLFIVSPDGAATNVTDRAKSEQKSVRAMLPMQGITADDRGYLMLAVGSDKPLKALDTPKAEAADLVTGIRNEARAEDARLEAAVIYFRRR